MMKTQHIFFGLSVLGLSSIAHAQRPEKTTWVEDFRMGNSLWLQAKDAKKGVEINTELAKPARRFDNPDSKDPNEIKEKKMIVLGFSGTYSLGYYVFYDELHPEQFPPHNQKSIYSLCDIYDENKATMHIGNDLMLAGFDPVGVLNSPWQKVADFTTRTSTIVQVPLKYGLNFVKFQLDPQNKIYEAKRTDSSPWVKLEDNNKATFAVELVKPPIIVLPKPKK